MALATDILKLLAGIGLFLLAMYLIEEALKNLSGRNFKLFLQRITKNRAGAVAGGAIVTGVLQSSSMVSLMVLAFVGAGVFTMKNAMAIILGANLGTTLDSWLVAGLGFKVNIEIAAYPAVFLGGLLLIIFSKHKTIQNISFFLIGFGLLFIALSFMKTAMEGQVKQFNLSVYSNMPPLVFLGIGFLITLLVQSSSVTMALTLSALHVGAIAFLPAAALVLGSETGTTIKILLGGIGGNASKKRVVLGNLLFNIFLTIFAFIFLKPILYLITDLLAISDPLIGLVSFSSFVNLMSILIFLPFLNLFAKFLEQFYKDSDASATAFIDSSALKEPQTALDLFKKETAFFIHDAVLFNLMAFSIDPAETELRSEFSSLNERRKFTDKTPEARYEFLKQWQGELQAYYLELRTKIDGAQAPVINQYISSVRSAMYSVKCIKDIGSNMLNLSRSSKDIKFSFYLNNQKQTEQLYTALSELLINKEPIPLNKLEVIFDQIQKNYTSSLENFYKSAETAAIDDMDLTTAINFNRELFTSNKAMLMAVKDFLLEEDQAQQLNELLVYKT